MIHFFNNKLNFIKTNFNHSIIRNLKNEVFDDYNKFISKITLLTIDKNTVNKIFIWKKMSTIWFNNILKKDIEGDSIWAKRLFIIYLMKNDKKIKLKTDDKILSETILKNFKKNRVIFFKKDYKKNLSLLIKKNIYINTLFFIFKNLFLAFCIKIILNKKFTYDPNKKYIWIRSLYPVNTSCFDDNIYDRNYSKRYYREKNFKNLLQFKSYEKLSFFAYLSLIIKIKKYKNIHLIDINVSFTEIVRTGIENIIDYLKSKKLFKNLYFKSNLKIGELDISYIFDDLWFSSYHHNSSPQYKLDSIKYENFFKKFSKKQIFFTYGEFFINNRPVYNVIKKLNPNNKIISIQHSYNFKNYTTVFNDKIIFDYYNKKDKYLCPYPDFFFIQGKHYFNILNKFYPKKNIKILGNQKITNQVALTKKKEDKIKIIITPSIMDFDLILSFIDLKKINFNNFKITIKIHPSMSLNNQYILNFMKKKISSNIEFISSKQNLHSLLSGYDILICCHSNIILEALDISSLFKLRVQKPEEFEFFDNEKNIKVVYSKKDLTNFLNNFKVKKSYVNLKKEKNYYFSSFTNKKYNESIKILNTI